MAGKVNFEFKAALEKRRILPFSKGKQLVKKEIKQAEDDLIEAKDRFKNEKYKYTTITAYYSMFHTARALVYSKNYREKSHYYLLVAVQSLFVEQDMLEEKLVKDFHYAMVLREDADYHGNFSKDGAESCIESADKFLRKVKSILNVK